MDKRVIPLSDTDMTESSLAKFMEEMDFLCPCLRRVEWTPKIRLEDDLSIQVGVSNMDKKNQEIFAALRELQNCEDCERKKAVEIMRILIANFRVLFEAEEAAMKCSCYPGGDLHKQEHDIFIANLRMLLCELVKKGVLTGAELGPLLELWQRIHISKMDRAYASHMEIQPKKQTT